MILPKPVQIEKRPESSAQSWRTEMLKKVKKTQLMLTGVLDSFSTPDAVTPLRPMKYLQGI